MKLPDRIMARPMMDVTSHRTSGPWSIDDPFGNASEYVRADLYAAQVERAAKLEATLRAARATFIRMDFAEGSIAIESIDAALAQREAVTGDTNNDEKE